MPKQLMWKTNDIEIKNSQNQKVKHILHSTISESSLTQPFESIVIECIKQATGLLAKNLTDSSRYFMFEWHHAQQVLTILVTDDSKTNDSTHIVRCQFTDSLQGTTNSFETKSEDHSQSINQDLSQRMRECIHNYMTTCNEFMQYSLIAVYHDSVRDNAVLV